MGKIGFCEENIQNSFIAHSTELKLTNTNDCHKYGRFVSKIKVYHTDTDHNNFDNFGPE